MAACPAEVADEFEADWRTRKAIYRPAAQPRDGAAGHRLVGLHALR